MANNKNVAWINLKALVLVLAAIACLTTLAESSCIFPRQSHFDAAAAYYGIPGAHKWPSWDFEHPW